MLNCVQNTAHNAAPTVVHSAASSGLYVEVRYPWCLERWWKSVKRSVELLCSLPSKLCHRSGLKRLLFYGIEGSDFELYCLHNRSLA